MSIYHKRWLYSAVALSIVMLSACSFTKPINNDAAEEVKSMSENAVIAQVYDVDINNKVLKFTTESTGCTSQHNFALSVEHEIIDGVDTTQVTINQIKPDYCKAMPRPVVIEMPIPFETRANIVITNPVLLAPKMKKPNRS